MTKKELRARYPSYENHNLDMCYETDDVDILMDLWATEVSSSPWIQTSERPLVTKNENGHWECTEDGNNEFIAAVPYIKNNEREKTLWWIRLCVIEDTVGLCVVGDDDNEPAGWTIDDVTHYFHLPIPPKN